MLYLDGISISKIRKELENNLKNKKINRIFQKNEYAISLFFGKIELTFSTLPNFSICYINDEKEKPLLDIASNFISSLRSKLLNATLVNINQLGFDRVLVFNFSKINELGEEQHFKIIFELFSKASNIIFTENNKIISIFKREGINSKRVLFNGAEYESLTDKTKISPDKISREEFNKFKNNAALMQKIEGYGKLLNENVTTYDDFKKIINDNLKATIYFKNQKIILTTVLDFSFKDYEEKKDFDNFFEMINFYIKYTENTTSFSILKNKLSTIVNKKLNKNLKILDNVKKDLQKEDNLDSLLEKANIFSSSLHLVKKGMSSIELYDFYNNEQISINLNPLFNANDNLKLMYKNYSKTKKTIENAKRRENEIQNEITYLSSIELFIENSQNLENLRNIEDELIKYNYIKLTHKTKNTKIRKEIKFGTYEKNDCIFYYGRNNLENDNLTMKFAGKNDLWFHAKNIPGSHVILKSEFINEENILIAAKLAAFYSKANMLDKIEIDYTLKKYINKPKNAKLAFVTYTNARTILVKKEEIDATFKN